MDLTKIIIGILAISCLLGTCSAESPPNKPYTIYGEAYDSDGDPVGPGVKIKLYINGDFHASVETQETDRSDSAYSLCFDSSDLDSSDSLRLKVGSSWGVDSFDFDDSGDDVTKIDLHAKSGGDDGSESPSSDPSSNSGTGSTGVTNSGIVLPKPSQTESEPKTEEDSPKGGQEEEKGLEEEREKKTSNQADDKSPTGGAIADVVGIDVFSPTILIPLLLLIIGFLALVIKRIE